MSDLGLVRSFKSCRFPEAAHLPLVACFSSDSLLSSLDHPSRLFLLPLRVIKGSKLQAEFKYLISTSQPHLATMSGQHSSSSSDGAELKRVESLSISPEMFEKLYLSPENNIHGDLRKTFGNPTPLSVYLPYFSQETNPHKIGHEMDKKS